MAKKKKPVNLCYHCGRKLMNNEKKFADIVETPAGAKAVWLHKICKENPDMVLTDWDDEK